MGICRSNEFFFFYKAKCARPKNRARLRGFVRQSVPDRHRASDLSSPEKITLNWIKYTLMTLVPNYFIVSARIPRSNAIIVIVIIIAMITVN